jgi:hypothetical protein
MDVNIELRRRVKIWRFSVSHSELVLMSTNDTGEYPTRWYALLKPARFICLPRYFACDRIRSAEREVGVRYEFVCGNEVHYVDADAFFHGEDNEPYYAPIPFGMTQ